MKFTISYHWFDTDHDSETCYENHVMKGACRLNTVSDKQRGLSETVFVWDDPVMKHVILRTKIMQWRIFQFYISVIKNRTFSN